MRIPESLQKLISCIVSAGGKPMLVGGVVVDSLLGVEPKDFDFEVHGLSMERLKPVLSDFSPKSVGNNFGVFKLDPATVGGLEVDVSIPRRDNRVGVGHTGFDVEFDPSMTSREAARRRDFTINSLFFDLEKQEIIDPFGGVADLEAGILRATDPEKFVEDPLRALRAMQLLARKAKTVDPATMMLIRGMVDEFDNLSKERIHEEFKKLLLKAEKPSVGLEFLRESGWLVKFPELHKLIGCEQHPEWHPEGDVWTHTLEVTDSAAWARDKIDPEWQEAFVFGAFLHDVGKPATTVTPEMVKAGKFPKERLWTAYGHDRAGVAPAETFLRRLTNNKKLIERATTIVCEHMQPFNLSFGEAGNGAWKRLHGKIRLDVIGWMSRCDSCGRPERNIGDPDIDHKISEHCFSRFSDLGAEPVSPILQGKDLIFAGLKPGPNFSVRLKAAHEAQLDNENLEREELLQIALAAAM